MLKKIQFSDGLKLFMMISVLILAFSSCTTPKRKLIYVNKIETGMVHPNDLNPETYLISPNDNLYIVIMGDDPMNTAFLNLTTVLEGISGADLELITYLVDENGNISFPQLGEVAVAGKTVLEVQDIIQERISSYIENTSVYVKMLGRTITVLGEVMDPGIQLIYKNQLTILEAIGTAGDLNDYADRRDVKLFRKTEAGTEVASIDLTDPALLYSDHYYIYPNDVIYVQPKSRVFGFKTLGYTDLFTVFLAITTTILLVLTFFQNQ